MTRHFVTRFIGILQMAMALVFVCMSLAIDSRIRETNRRLQTFCTSAMEALQAHRQTYSQSVDNVVQRCEVVTTVADCLDKLGDSVKKAVKWLPGDQSDFYGSVYNVAQICREQARIIRNYGDNDAPATLKALDDAMASLDECRGTLALADSSITPVMLLGGCIFLLNGLAIVLLVPACAAKAPGKPNA